MAVAQAEGLHPATAARDFHIIQGRPALKADAMLARFQQAGGTVNWEEYTDAKVTGRFTHPNGGSLDWVTASGLVPEFAQVMTTLKAGELASSPVKSQFGWHIIQVDEIKDTPTPSMQEVKPQLVQMLTQDQNWQKFKFSEMMEKFKSKAKIQ
jgi:peptidyl-prolyl cis-trans isomerase C